LLSIVSCHFPATLVEFQVYTYPSLDIADTFGQLGLISTISELIPLHNIKWIC